VPSTCSPERARGFRVQTEIPMHFRDVVARRTRKPKTRRRLPTKILPAQLMVKTTSPTSSRRDAQVNSTPTERTTTSATDASRARSKSAVLLYWV
jgi:hypothetical protein